MGDQSASETKRRYKCERVSLSSFPTHCSQYKKMQRKAFMTKRPKSISTLSAPWKKNKSSSRKLPSCRVASFKEHRTSALRVRNGSPGLRHSKSVGDITSGLCASGNSRYQWDRPFPNEERYSNAASYSANYPGCKRTGGERTPSRKISSSFCDSKNLNYAAELNCGLLPGERMEDSDDEDFTAYAVKDEWFSDADSDSYEILDAVQSDEGEESVELCSDSKVSMSREVEVGYKFCPAKSEEESGASTRIEKVETPERVEVSGLHITRVISPTKISSGTSNVNESEQISCHSINGENGILPTERAPASRSESVCISDSQSSLCEPIYSETFVSSSSNLKLATKCSAYDSEVPNACDRTEVLRTDIFCPSASERKPVSKMRDHSLKTDVSATFSSNNAEKAGSTCKQAVKKQVTLPSSCTASFELRSREVNADDNHSKAVTVTSGNTKQCDSIICDASSATEICCITEVAKDNYKASPDSNVSIKTKADSRVSDSKVVLEHVKPVCEQKKRNYSYLDAVVAESAEIAAKKKKLAELVNARLKSSYFGKQDSALELDMPSLPTPKVSDNANRVENSHNQDAACVTDSKQEAVEEVSSPAFEPPNNDSLPRRHREIIADVEVVYSLSENVTCEQTSGLYEDKQSKGHVNDYENSSSIHLGMSPADGNDDDQRYNSISSYLNFDACSDELDSTRETRDDCYALIKRACLDADFGDGASEAVSECTSKQQPFFSGLAIQKAKPVSTSENLATGRKKRVSYLNPCMLPFFDLGVPVYKSTEVVEDETFCDKGSKVSHQSGYANSMFSQEPLSKSLVSPHVVSHSAAKAVNVPKTSEKATAEACLRRAKPLWEKTRRELKHIKRNITNSSKQKAHLYGKLEKPEKETDVCVSEGGITMEKRNREKRRRKFSAGTHETNFSKHHLHEQITVSRTTTSKNSGDLKPNQCWNKHESLETGKKCDVLEKNEVVHSDNSLVKNNSKNRFSSRMCTDPERVLETWKKQIYMGREKSRDGSSIFKFSSVLSSFRIPKPPKPSQSDVGKKNPSDSETVCEDQGSLSEGTNSSTGRSYESDDVGVTRKKVRRIQKLPSDSEDDDGPCIQKEKNFTGSNRTHKELRVCIEKLRFEDFPSNRTCEEVSIPSTEYLTTPLKDCDPNITDDVAARFQRDSAFRRKKSHLGRKRKRKLKVTSPKPTIVEKPFPKSFDKLEVLANTDPCPSPGVTSLPDTDEMAPGNVTKEVAETTLVVETRSTDSCACDDVTNTVSVKQGNPQPSDCSSKQLQTDALCDDDDDDIQIIDIKLNRELRDRHASSYGEVADALPVSSYSNIDNFIESSSCGIPSNSFTFCIADVRSLDEHEWPAAERKSHSVEEFCDKPVECASLEVHSSDIISVSSNSTDFFINTSRTSENKSYTSSEVADTYSAPFGSSASCLENGTEKRNSSLPTADYSIVDFLAESPAVLKASTNVMPSSVISPETACSLLRTKTEDDAPARDNDRKTGNTADSPEHVNRILEGAHNECASGKFQNLIEGQGSNDTKNSVNCIVCGRQTASFCSRCFRRCCYHNFYSGCFLKHFTECRTDKVANKPWLTEDSST